MPPVYAADTVAFTGGGGTLSDDIDVSPLGLATDDKLVVVTAWRGDYGGGHSITGSGWTEPEDLTQTNGPSGSLFHKDVAGGDPTTYTVSVSGSATRNVVAAFKLPGPGVTVDGVDAQIGTSTTPTAPTLTPVLDDLLVVRWFIYSHADTLSNWPPSGTTDQLSQGSGGAAAGHVSMLIATDNAAGAAGVAVGTKNVTLSSSRNWVAGTIMFHKPPPGGGGSNPFQRWNGSAFVTGGTIKRWNGSAFVTGGTLRRWNGTSFVPAP